ncbi:MAG: hypothetical protein ACK4TJ_09505 [Tabrizicola sp.]
MKAIVIPGPADLRIEERPVAALSPGQLRLRLATGGVCGLDLDDCDRGGPGAVRLREPMILGPEVRVRVEDRGDTAKKLALRGSFRFPPEFAVGLGLIDVKPLVTRTMPLARVVDAFRRASDRSRAMTAQTDFPA